MSRSQKPWSICGSLHENGEIEWTNVSAQAAYEMTFLDEKSPRTRFC